MYLLIKKEGRTKGGHYDDSRKTEPMLLLQEWEETLKEIIVGMLMRHGAAIDLPVFLMVRVLKRETVLPKTMSSLVATPMMLCMN